MNLRDCTRCNGTGIGEPDDFYRLCEDCSGTGLVADEDQPDDEDEDP